MTLEQPKFMQLGQQLANLRTEILEGIKESIETVTNGGTTIPLKHTNLTIFYQNQERNVLQATAVHNVCVLLSNKDADNLFIIAEKLATEELINIYAKIESL